MGAKGAVAPKAPDQVFGECFTALEVRSFSRLPTVQSAELYLLYLPNTLPPAGAHAPRTRRPGKNASDHRRQQEHPRRLDDEPAKAAASCRLVKRNTPAGAPWD
jgi:hypothetical protein